MPSLRRIISSPSVRSSPYPSLTSSGGRVQGDSRRRSSGSETTSRRVLADIEWWKVVGGQDAPRDPDGESSEDRENEPEVHDQGLSVYSPLGGALLNVGAERPLAPEAWSTFTPASPHAFHMSDFAALSIAPHTPTRRHHSLESSVSSLELTPEALETPLEYLRLDMAGMNLGFADAGSPALSSFTTDPKRLQELLGTHSYSFPDIHLHDDPFVEFSVSTHVPELVN